jgi:hypothetical protein
MRPTLRAYEFQTFPDRNKAQMPQDRVAEIPWLLVLGSVLISPYPARKDGPTEAEAQAISAMQRRLARSPIAVWISADGKMTP